MGGLDLGVVGGVPAAFPRAFLAACSVVSRDPAFDVSDVDVLLARGFGAFGDLELLHDGAVAGRVRLDVQSMLWEAVVHVNELLVSLHHGAWTIEERR